MAPQDYSHSEEFPAVSQRRGLFSLPPSPSPLRMSSADTFLSVQTWGMFLESLFFGFYLITCVSVFRAPARLGWWKLVLFFLFLAKTSSSIALHLDLNLYLATINQPVDTLTELRSTANPLNIGKYTTGLIEVVLGSGFFTYRCWLTYNRNYLVVLPSALMMLGGVVVMCMVIRIDVAHKVDGILAESFTLGAVFWGLFLAVNLVSTTLIIYRLVCTARRTQESAAAFDVHPDFLVEDRDDVQSATTSGMPTKLQSPLTRPEPLRARCHYDSGRTRNIIVDSASLPTLSLLLTFVLFVVKTQAVYAAVDVLVQVIGIAFNLIMAGNRNPAADENLNLDAERHELHALARLTPGRHGSSRMTPASMQSSGIDFAFPRTFDPRRPAGPTQSQTESLERATLTATPLPGETVTRTEESFLAADASVSRTQTRSRGSLY
ncbi:hypothetical protein HMN09_00670700 [Mycena chlorophos]|uniref:Uncharacterized protein n=1 Tax=Mycena chlorophos TaxID=658473 RepID=A0A8H6SZM5_MYCCL|nr:hypothetical protein HMN09_00670700 [Mycena chlorophos]